MLPSVVEELQRALEHRHQLTKPTPVLVQLWTQLEKTLAEGHPQVQQSSRCLQLFLDIDHTLLYTYSLKDVFIDSEKQFPDPDMQHFYGLAESFWRWYGQAIDHFGDEPWPLWLPSAEVDGKQYTMWFPASVRDNPNPIPEFIAPMWDQEGTLTHYILMFANISFSSRATSTGGQQRVITNHSIRMAVVPAEVTLLAYLRYEFAAKVDKLRSSEQWRQTGREEQSEQGQDCLGAAESGSTQVELYLATAACESYMNKLCHLLEQLLSCQHGGQVFADKASFSNWTEDDYQSHTGIKNIKVFQLKQSTDGLICLRLVVDDHLWWWGEKEAPGTTRLLPIMGWNGRWEDLNREEVDYIQGDKHKVDFVTPIETPEVLECPVAPEGLSRLLPEVLQLLDQALKAAEPPPVIPAAAAPANTLSAVYHAIQDYPRIAALKARLLPYLKQLKNSTTAGAAHLQTSNSRQLQQHAAQPLGLCDGKPAAAGAAAVGVAALMPLVAKASIQHSKQHVLPNTSATVPGSSGQDSETLLDAAAAAAHASTAQVIERRATAAAEADASECSLPQADQPYTQHKQPGYADDQQVDAVVEIISIGCHAGSLPLKAACTDCKTAADAAAAVNADATVSNGINTAAVVQEDGSICLSSAVVEEAGLSSTPSKKRRSCGEADGIEAVEVTYLTPSKSLRLSSEIHKCEQLIDAVEQHIQLQVVTAHKL